MSERRYSEGSSTTSEKKEKKKKPKEYKPEESIPDKPENENARNFLKNAPSKGLWLPMGVEVKVMKCWRCKAYGHRTNDRECPMSATGNLMLDAERQAREDPMAKYIAAESHSTEDQEHHPKSKKEQRKRQLQELMEDIRKDEQKKKHKKKHKKVKSKKKKSKKKRRKYSSSSSSGDERH